MQSLGGLLAIVYTIGMVTLGILDWPLWVPLVGAIVALIAYIMVRPGARLSFAEMWDANQMALAIKLAVGIYVFQLLPACALYGLGRAIGYFT